MANELDVKFGTFELESGTEFLIESIDVDERKSVTTHKIPKTDGSIAETARREEVTISIKGTVGNSDYDALRTSVDNLKAALQDGLQKFTIDDDRYIMAQIESFKKEWVVLRRLVKFSASFVAHFPFWLSETEHEDDRIPTSGTGYVITNAGNAPTRVKIEITAPSVGISDNCKIENQTSGDTFQYRGDIAGYDVLEVDNRYDTDDFEVLNDGADDHANFEGDFITLEPGDNTIIFTGQFGTSVKITHRDCWY